MQSYLPPAGPAGPFSYAVLASRILGTLGSEKALTRNALRAATVWNAVDGSNRTEFHRSFETTLDTLIEAGAVMVRDDERLQVTGTEPPSPPLDLDDQTSWRGRPIDRDSVMAAMDEFDRNGRDETLAVHGFGRARDYVVLRDGKEYDSKALYAIAYGIKYPRDSPIRDRGLVGGRQVVKKLHDLGFVVRKLSAVADAALTRKDAKAWIVRAGRMGEHEALARREGVALVEAPDLGPIEHDVARGEIAMRIAGRGGVAEDMAIDKADALHRFAHDLQVGDMVVLPLVGEPGTASIGVLEGGLRHRSDGPFANTGTPYQRPVNWLQWAVPFESFDSDLRSVLRSSTAPLSQIPQDDASGRLLRASATAPSRTTAFTPSPPSLPPYVEQSLEDLQRSVLSAGLKVDPRMLLRYHVSLRTRGFVILAGVSGGGKTWLAQAYAAATNARSLVVAVAPNWTTNEDLLGYANPLDDEYRHTEFSWFLLEAAMEHDAAEAASRPARPFHLILDEMNLARVEQYFAKFLSAMELRARAGMSAIVLSPTLTARLTPNLVVIGTVNVDETTFGFADKVYDRAQLIEIHADRKHLEAHVGDRPYKEAIMQTWDAVRAIAPFAYRVIDEIDTYISNSVKLGLPWEDAFDDQLLQKVLPKLKGTDPKVGAALQAMLTLTDGKFPQSQRRVDRMLQDFNAQGFVSFF